MSLSWLYKRKLGNTYSYFFDDDCCAKLINQNTQKTITIIIGYGYMWW